MATLSCRCGAVQIQFPSRVPRSHSACCCVDCQKRLKVLEDQGGPKLDYDKPITVINFANKMQVIKGREKLQFFKLAQDSNMTNLASTCCSTYLIGRSNMYHGNAVATMPGYGVLQDYEEIPLIFLSFRDQWPSLDKIRLETEVPEIWKAEDGEQGIVGSEGWNEAMSKVMEGVSAPIADDIEGDSFEELIETTGAAVKVI